MNQQLMLTVMATLLTLLTAFGQSGQSCNFGGPVFTRAQKGAQFKGSIQAYFEYKLQGKLLDHDGSVRLKILIDTSGKACSELIESNSSPIETPDLREIINEMPDWIPAYQNNHAVHFAANIILNCKDEKLTVDYTNEKAVIPQPVINTNTSNHPQIVREKKTNTIWKLWNFGNSMLPSSLSRNISMDKKGAIWCCTDNGVVRIMGDDWQVFNAVNTPALAGNLKRTVTSGVAVDSNDNVWIQSFGSIVKFDGRQWVKYDTTNSPLTLVRKINVDRNGIIWFCTLKGLIKFDGNNWTKFSTANSKIASDDVKEVYLDEKEALWIATDKGINKLTNGEWSTIAGPGFNHPENDITCIKGDRYGNIWAGLITKDKSFLVVIDSSGKTAAYPSESIWSIGYDQHTNTIWLATSGAGLMSFNGKDINQFDYRNSLIPGTMVLDVLVDRNGDKWIATDGGLVFTNKK